jgi:hypothetical protein
MSVKEASNAYGMLAERSLVASSCIAIVHGVGCDPPSLTLLLLSPLQRDLHRRPSPVSARRGPRTCPLTCSLLLSSSTLPSSSSSACRHRQPTERSLSTSLHITVVGGVGCNPSSSLSRPTPLDGCPHVGLGRFIESML